MTSSIDVFAFTTAWVWNQYSSCTTEAVSLSIKCEWQVMFLHGSDSKERFFSFNENVQNKKYNDDDYCFRIWLTLFSGLVRNCTLDTHFADCSKGSQRPRGSLNRATGHGASAQEKMWNWWLRDQEQFPGHLDSSFSLWNQSMSREVHPKTNTWGNGQK